MLSLILILISHLAQGAVLFILTAMFATAKTRNIRLVKFSGLPTLNGCRGSSVGRSMTWNLLSEIREAVTCSGAIK